MIGWTLRLPRSTESSKRPMQARDCQLLQPAAGWPRFSRRGHLALLRSHPAFVGLGVGSATHRFHSVGFDLPWHLVRCADQFPFETLVPSMRRAGIAD